MAPQLQGATAAQAKALQAKHQELATALAEAEARWEQDGTGVQVRGAMDCGQSGG